MTPNSKSPCQAASLAVPAVESCGSVQCRPTSTHWPRLEFHGTEIPADVIQEAQRQSSSPYECLLYTRAFHPDLLAQLRHIVVRRPEAVVVLSFLMRGSTLSCVNRLVDLSEDVLADVARKLFELHAQVNRIAIEIPREANSWRLPEAICARTWRTIEDMVVTLPQSIDEYLARFGAKTRKNLRYCENRLMREHPGLQFEIAQRGNIEKSAVWEIVNLNHLRMSNKGRASGMDRRFADSLHELIAICGVACVARNGDKILGGTLCSHVGRGLTLHVIAHDPEYNHVRLGLLCLLKSVEFAINQGGDRFHFLWGPAEYKRLFGAVERPLFARRYYRSVFRRILYANDFRDLSLQWLKRRARRLRSRFAGQASEPS